MAFSYGSKTFPFFEAQLIIITANAKKVFIIGFRGPARVNKSIVKISAFKLIIELVIED